MVIRTANTYRLYPTPEQAQQMAQIAGSCRFVFNPPYSSPRAVIAI
jgi:hypothetical protein